MSYFAKPRVAPRDGYDIKPGGAPDEIWRLRVPQGGYREVALCSARDQIVRSNNPNVVQDKDISETGSKSEDVRILTIHGANPGFTVLDCVPPGSNSPWGSVQVQVVAHASVAAGGGAPHRHPGYDVDLLYELAISGDADDMDMYKRILSDAADESHVLSQSKTKMNCGNTAQGYGPLIFKKKIPPVNTLYYSQGTSNKLADLRFDEKRVAAGIHTIKNLLNKGTPVRVYLIHHDGFKMPIVNDGLTHFVTIIGYSESMNKFLFLDPWPTGSQFRYDGGVLPTKWNNFMGELTWDPSRLGDLGIHTPFSGATGAHTVSAAGDHAYRVIGGP
jgi:hypothetical protein